MQLANLMTDSIDLLKQDGTKKQGLKASVQGSQIFLYVKDILVEPNDLIVRKMSNGAEETYRVIDPGFREAFLKIPAGYQMNVQKLGLPEATSAVQSITFNINGNNARVNQGSIDNSTNIVQIDARAMQHIEALRREIHGSNISGSEKEEAQEVIDEVESALQSGKPKKSVIMALLRALPQVANVASIVSAVESFIQTM